MEISASLSAISKKALIREYELVLLNYIIFPSKTKLHNARAPSFHVLLHLYFDWKCYVCKKEEALCLVGLESL